MTLQNACAFNSDNFLKCTKRFKWVNEYRRPSIVRHFNPNINCCRDDVQADVVAGFVRAAVAKAAAAEAGWSAADIDARHRWWCGKSDVIAQRRLQQLQQQQQWLLDTT